MTVGRSCFFAVGGSYFLFDAGDKIAGPGRALTGAGRIINCRGRQGSDILSFWGWNKAR